jgi:hypothetical protein
VHAERVPCGAPEARVVHVPMLPETSHAWHWPPQALLQQTPSVQTPLVHSFAAPHPAASAFFATQWCEALQ